MESNGTRVSRLGINLSLKEGSTNVTVSSTMILQFVFVYDICLLFPYDSTDTNNKCDHITVFSQPNLFAIHTACQYMYLYRPIRKMVAAN